MKFPSDFIEKVREANNIVDIISQHVQLQKAGSSYKGLCPFPGHAEKTPSFHVSDIKQVYHCFGCGKSGNAFTFLMDFQGLPFPEAVEFLAQRANITLPDIKNDKFSDEREKELKLLNKLNKYVAAYFHKNLNQKSEDSVIKKYIHKRDLSPEIIEEFKLGYAEDSWSRLSDVLRSGKAPLDRAAQLGLIKKKQNQEYFDIFRDRLIFPIISASGNVLGFGGRSLDDKNQPKYLNSPETLLFNKSRSLYGVHATAKYIRTEGEAILVEGYMDLLSLYQAGIKNVVATLGTAFTVEHARAIKKLCPKVIVLFDSDKAGRAAAERALPFFLEENILSRCLILEGAKDPDEFIKMKGADVFKKLAKGAPDHFSVILNSKLVGYKGRPTEKKEILDSIKPLLDRVTDQQLRSLYLQEVADRLNIDTGVLARSKPVQNMQVVENKEKIRKSIPKIEIPKDEKLLVQFMLVDKAYLEKVRDSGVVDYFVSEDAQKIARQLMEKYCQNPNDFDKLAASLLSEETFNFGVFDTILKNGQALFTESRPKDVEEERRWVDDCVESVKQKSLKLKSKQILNSLKIEDADLELTQSKLKDFMELVKEQKGPQRR